MTTKPSAILNIECLANDVSELQKYEKNGVALLRLFKLGSVKEIRSKHNSDSIIDIVAQGTITNGFPVRNYENYSIYKKDELKLKEFWNKLFEILPNSFGLNPKIDYLTIAFNRYNDSLFESPIHEKRVAEAVMGLEALFLKSKDDLGNQYKLSIRIAQIFGLIGHDSIKTKRTIQEAYKIRNRFVHGGHYKMDEITKMENNFIRKKKFHILDDKQTMSDFIRNIIEFLRVSIILIILIRNGESDTAEDKMKKVFIDSIDDSLIDKDKEKELKGLLKSFNPYLSQIN